MSERSGSVIPIHDAQDLAVVGTKARSLSMLDRAGLPVPNGFCVPAEAYREHAQRAGVESLTAILRQVPADAPDLALSPILQRIRAAITHTPLDPDLEKEVLTRFGLLESPSVSVRSSVTEVDMPSGPLVGRHGTYFAAGSEAMLRSVKHCWASLWGNAVWAHRLHNQLSDTIVSVAVVVQHLVPATASGVVFTADPQSGDPARIVIDSCFGLGEAIVAGTVPPDRFRLSRDRLRLTESELHPKHVRLTIDDEGAVVQRMVAPELVHAPSLTEAEARTIAQLALRAEALFDGPAVVEFALAAGVAWMLQARPLVVGR
jgi:phosphoenolpyruvate synthase/pyruvate phosphate dikinase